MHASQGKVFNALAFLEGRLAHPYLKFTEAITAAVDAIVYNRITDAICKATRVRGRFA